MKKNTFIRDIDKPLMHPDHKRPVTRREFVSQGFSFGTGLAMGGSLAGLLGSNKTHADLPQELQDILSSDACGGFNEDDAKIPFICFDLAGGANFAGSSVLVGGPDGQEDYLDSGGYRRLGLPGEMTPDQSTALVNSDFGLKFHSDSPYLRGLMEKAPLAAQFTNGAVIPARSENDTGNNPHNPMYAINKIGANGRLLSLIGSRSSDSGGNSMAPMAYMDPSVRPTKIDRASDARGLVDTGELINLLGGVDTNAVMESVYHLTQAKMGRLRSSSISTNEVVESLIQCGYLKAASNAQQTPDDVDPNEDDDIIDLDDDTRSIFTEREYLREREFRKTAAIMKLVIDGWAGAGTITMGGYDYHGGRRARGEARDLRAGRCIGAVLEYARRKNKPVMIYVFSDGSLSSNGMIDDQAGDGLTGIDQVEPGGRGKGEWTSDNQQTACSWFLVYNPGSRPQLMSTNGTPEQHQQLGHFRPNGSVETSATVVANNVNLLVDTVALNYMALHDDVGGFVDMFGNQLGNSTSDLERLIAFQPIV